MIAFIDDHRGDYGVEPTCATPTANYSLKLSIPKQGTHRQEKKMKQYPVHVYGASYRGADPKTRQKAQNESRVAARIQEYINEEIAKWPDDSVGSILSIQVATAIGEDNALVHRIIYSIEGGANGVTIYKGDYDRAMKRTPPLRKS
jgi:hypothetical protein